MGKIESVLGVEIFEWQDWDDVDIDVLQFYDVKFKFDSLKNIMIKLLLLTEVGLILKYLIIKVM